MIKMLLAGALAIACGAVSARTMSVTAFTDTTVSLAFGEPDGKDYSLCIGYGTTDGGTDKYAWTSFAKDVATIAANDTAKTITLPDGVQAAGIKYRLFLMQTTGSMPYESELEYIESTNGGNQYIDSGIIGRDGTGMECDVAYTLDSNVDKTLIGCRKNTNHTRYFLAHASGGKWGIGHNYYQAGDIAHVKDQKVHLVSQAKAGSQTLTVDGKSAASYTDSVALDTGLSMYIFAANLYGSVKQQLAARLYNMKITQDGNLVRRYYPVKLSNGDGALYDEVTGTVFANKNTSNKFTLGAARTDRFGIVKATAAVAAAKSEITFSGYKGSETLKDFPALIRLPGGVPGFSYSRCKSDGSDIYFLDADGNVLASEIDTWDTSGESLIWVRVPTLTKTTKITMFWGGAKPAAGATTAWQNYIGVWHMNKASGATGAIVAEPDRTGNGFDLTPTKGKNGTDDKLAQVKVLTGGPVGSCVQNQTEMTNAVNGLKSKTGILGKLSSVSKFTVSGWFNVSAVKSGSAMRAFAVKNAYKDTTGWEVQMNGGSETWATARGSSTDGVGVDVGNFKTDWRFLTFVYDGTKVTVYSDGVRKDDGTKTIAAVKTWNNNVFTVGNNGSVGEWGLCGCSDEVRYYNGTLSADRVAADYDTVKALDFAVAAAAVPVHELTWQGAAGDDWWGADKWLCEGLDATFDHGEKTLFNGTSGTESAVVSRNAVVGGLTANNDVEITGAANLVVPAVDVAAGKTARVSANITGTVAKGGAGTLALGGGSSATVSVNAGTLALAGTGGYGATTVNVANGATVGADGAAATVALKSFMPASGATIAEGLTLSSDDSYNNAAFWNRTINVNGTWILKPNGVKDNKNNFIALRGATLKGTGMVVSESFGMASGSSCTFNGVTLLATSQWVFGRTWGTLNLSDVTLRMQNDSVSNYFTAEGGKFTVADGKTLTIDTRNATNETQTCDYTMNGDGKDSCLAASSGKLRKVGGGTLTFDYDMPLTGAVSVEGGTLRLNKGCKSTSVAVAAGATLEMLAGGATNNVTVAAGGVFAAVKDAAVEFTDATLTLADGAVLAYEVKRTGDAMAFSPVAFGANGAIALPQSGKVKLRFDSLEGLRPGERHTLVKGAKLTQADLGKFELETPADGIQLLVKDGDLVLNRTTGMMILVW